MNASTLLRGAILVLVTTWAATAAAQTVTLSFQCLTNNNLGDCAIGEAQLSLELSDAGSGKIFMRRSHRKA